MKATDVTVGLAESNGSLLPSRPIWRDSLHVTCGLTACTPGSAPGPTLGNEYGKTLPFLQLRMACLPVRREQSIYYCAVDDDRKLCVLKQQPGSVMVYCVCTRDAFSSPEGKIFLNTNASLSICCRVRGVEGSCAKRLTIEFYTVVILLIFIVIIISIPLPLSSFIPGLEHSFSANPSHRSLPFLLQK